MKRILLILLVFVIQVHGWSIATGNVIHVSRQLRMSYLEPMPPKDFFVDLGQRDGVKVGDIVEVFRMIPVVNSMSGGPWHLMRVSLGEMKLVFVGESTSIGRVEVEREPASFPTMEYQSIMLGDQVQVKAPSLPFSQE